MPCRVTSGDATFYIAAAGSRSALSSSSTFAARLGHNAARDDDVLGFHLIFGHTVPLTLNSVANLGYAECRFLKNLYPGDTITATSEVIGAKQTSNAKTGIVYLRFKGADQTGEPVIEFVRWELMRKRDEESPAPKAVVPSLAKAVMPGDLLTARLGDWRDYDCQLARSPYTWEDYEVGERIDHIDGITLEEAEHVMITRLYQNTSKLYVDQFTSARE